MFGKNLKRLRERKGFMQKELADKIGVGFSTISMWEKGDRIPDADMLIKLANFFDVTTDYLLGIENLHKETFSIDDTVITTYKNNEELLSDKDKELIRNMIEHLGDEK